MATAKQIQFRLGQAKRKNLKLNKEITATKKKIKILETQLNKAKAAEKSKPRKKAPTKKPAPAKKTTSAKNPAPARKTKPTAKKGKTAGAKK